MIFILSTYFRGFILFQTVKFCLENGGKISHQQHELTCAVHLACYQGSLELVKLMFNMQPEEVDKCLDLPDAQGMTPLHYASMFDHVEIVKYLIQMVDINLLTRITLIRNDY